jgi:hypothetical protein
MSSTTLEVVDEPQQSTLAGPETADDAKDLASRDRQADVVQRLEFRRSG